MATYTHVEGFEHGDATTLTTWNGIFDGVGTAGGIPTSSATYARTGTRSLRVNKSSAGASWGRYAIGTDYVVGQVWIYLEALPGADGYTLLEGVSTTNAVSLRIITKADGTIGVKIGANAASYGTGVITADAWHRIDFKMFCQATTYTVDYAVNGVAQTQVTSGSRVATTVAYFSLGSLTAADVFDCYYDDVTLSVTSGDYPLTAASVYAVVPDADTDITHRLTVMQDNAGNLISDSYPAWSLVNQVGGSTTAYLQQNGTAADAYIECSFGNRTDPGGAVLAARAYVGLTSAGTAANDGYAYISDDSFSTQDTAYAGAMNPGTTPVRWKSAMLSNALDINNLRARIGKSTDGTPAPRWSLLMVQYAITASTITGQAVAVAATLTPAMVHLLGKTVAVGVTFVAALTRKILKPIATGVTTTLDIVKEFFGAGGNTYYQTIALTGLPADTLGFGFVQGGLERWDSATGADWLVGLSRQPGKLVVITIETVAGLVRSVGKAVAVAATFVADLVALALSLTEEVVIAVETVLGPAVARMVGKSFDVVATLTSTLVRQFSKSVSASLTLTAALARQIAKPIQLAVTLTADLVRRVGKLVAAAVSTTIALVADAGAHAFSKTIAAGVTFAAGILTKRHRMVRGRDVRSSPMLWPPIIPRRGSRLGR